MMPIKRKLMNPIAQTLNQLGLLILLTGPIVALGDPVESSSIKAEGGHDVGNGGDDLALHFSGVMTEILRIYSDLCKIPENADAPEFRVICQRDKLDSWRQVLTDYTVKVSDEVFGPDRKPRPAVNRVNGLPEIRFRERHYRNMKDVGIASLVTHEYASIVGLESSDRYEATNQILKLLDKYKVSIDLVVPELPSHGPRTYAMNHVCFDRVKDCVLFRDVVAQSTSEEVSISAECMKVAPDTKSHCKNFRYYAETSLTIRSPIAKPTYALKDVTGYECDHLKRAVTKLSVEEAAISANCVDHSLLWWINPN